MEQRFEWVSQANAAQGDTHQVITLTETALAVGSGAAIQWGDVSAVKVEQVHSVSGHAGSDKTFRANRLHVTLVANGQATRLKGSLSSKPHRPDFVTGLSALLQVLHRHRPDLSFREVKQPARDRDSQIWGGFLLLMAVIIGIYGMLDLGPNGGNLSVWAWIFVAMGAILGWIAGYLMIWPTLKAPDGDVSGQDMAERLAIAPLNVLKWSSQLPNVLVAGPLEPNEFHIFP